MFPDTFKRLLLTAILILACSPLLAADHVNATPAINMSDYFKVFIGLVFVIALFLGSTILFKRYGNSSMTGRGQIKLVDGLHLGNRERLVLVELNEKQILLSITPGHITKLDTLEKKIHDEVENA